MGTVTKEIRLWRGYHLTRDDIEGLCKSLAQGVRSESEVSIFLSLGRDKDVSKKGTEELFADNSIPPIQRQISLSCDSLSDQSKDYRSVEVSLGGLYCRVRTSGEDEVWVMGKCEQIRDFLRVRERKIRYWLSVLVEYVGGFLLISVSTVLLLTGYERASRLTLLVGWAFLLLSLISIFAGMSLVPTNVICLKEVREGWLKRNAGTLLAAVLGAVIGAAITFVLGRLYH